jgi:hypothetical protein
MTHDEGGKLYAFLKRVSEDPDELEKFRADPEESMERHGLDEKHRHALRSGDRAHVERELKAEGLAETRAMFCVPLEGAE